ncbi:DUF2938 domain-containing protein [Pseudoalteromonas luteoviolacea]|nr:DUF2938 domain-containing protein [Pseudoalteromonas luteoviolacea]
MYLEEGMLQMIGLSIIAGLGATVFMDIWSECLKRIFGVQSLNYGLVGRWVLHCLQGEIFHRNIMSAKPKNLEGVVGWIAHYLIGVLFALSFIFLTHMVSSSLLNPWLAIFFGTLTVCFPFFVMQPCFGMGIAASKVPRANIARLKSLGAHTSFGVGLYLTLLCISIFYT